jgi:hypothetical protein
MDGVIFKKYSVVDYYTCIQEDLPTIFAHPEGYARLAKNT